MICFFMMDLHIDDGVDVHVWIDDDDVGVGVGILLVPSNWLAEDGSVSMMASWMG